MVRGSGYDQRSGRRSSHRRLVVCRRTDRERSGGVRVGDWFNRLDWLLRMAHWQRVASARTCETMTLSATSYPSARSASLVGAALLGSMLVGAGMVMAYLTVATPFVPSLVPGASSTGGGIGLALGAWSIALVSAGGMLVAGASRLARILAMVRHTGGAGGPAARALAAVSDEVAVAPDLALGGGPAIPELVIGTFGAVVVHTLPASTRTRRGPAGWEARSSQGWLPTDDPLEAATRDADRVRHWLGSADVDFVVRVYAALLVTDSSVPRSPTCSSITADQLPAWLASLPRQRTLTTGRRSRLLGLAQTVRDPAHRTARGA